MRRYFHQAHYVLRSAACSAFYALSMWSGRQAAKNWRKAEKAALAEINAYRQHKEVSK